jgi:6-phosphogluconate dehydrogenase
LGFAPASPELKKERESDILLRYTFQDRQLSYYISAQTDKNKNESYFLLKVISPTANADLAQVEKKLHKDELDWQYYYLYTGKINHYLDKESRAAIIQVIIDNLGAKGGELYEDDNASSMASFTPLFDNGITVQEQKYNVQVAARSIQRQQEAIVYIGQPLIMGDY